jgi:hypothetical protein
MVERGRRTKDAAGAFVDPPLTPRDIMTRALNIGTTIFLTCLTCVGAWAASEENKCEDSCGKRTVWEEFNVLDLKATTPGKPGYESYRGQFDKESVDIQIDVETSDGRKISKGKILMIGGRAMATQGPVTEPGSEIDALDAAVLRQQLVTRLLGEALPNGPGEVRGVRKVDFSKEKTGIKFATPSAQGFIAPPWRVRGDIKIVAQDVIEYELMLTSGTKGKPLDEGGEYAANFTGRLSKTATAKIDDTMPLDEWSVFRLGVQTRKEGNSTVYDYGAAPTTVTYRTVADVRKKIARDDYPGEPDPSKNFTGFWKENCDQAFGLQIMPYGKDGKYSVIFCGPGGCGTQGKDGTNTFITKDHHYEVVSENEIKISNSNGWDRYHKCTKETNPILKYKDQ